MNHRQFRQYKKKFISAISHVAHQSQPGSLDEAAFPAYLHTNPCISFLFWKRLKIAMHYIEKHSPYKSILDFGTGSGVMLPFLCSMAEHVHAIDIDLSPLVKINKFRPLPGNLTPLQMADGQSDIIPTESFDLIVALDVLEHIEEREKIFRWLLGLLKPDGRIIFSGPTENMLYKLGRKIAGRQFTGGYHTSNIIEVKKVFSRFADVEHIESLFPIITFFDFYPVTKPF